MVTVIFALAVLTRGRGRPWLSAGLGGFLLGQLLGATVFTGWELVPVFGLSAAIGALMGALALVAERPLVTLASFFGVGFLAYTLCGIASVASPWNLVAFVAGGGIAVAALYRSYDWALIITSVLSVAGAIAATLVAWLAFVSAWGGWSAVAVALIVTVVGLIHQLRDLPTSTPSRQASGVARRAS